MGPVLSNELAIALSLLVGLTGLAIVILGRWYRKRYDEQQRRSS